MTDPLPEQLESQARVGVRVNSGSTAGIRRRINFIPGSSKVTITATDDATGEEVDVTLDVSAADLATALAGNGLDASGSTLVVDETELDHGLLTGKGDDDHPQYVLHSLADAKGDLLVGSANDDWNRKAAGSDYFVPQWLASATDGLQAGPTTQTWTPQVDQGASTNISKTVEFANYWRIGPLVFYSFYLTATGAGTSGSILTVSLPVTASASSSRIGSGTYVDISVGSYSCVMARGSTTNMLFQRSDVLVTGGIGNDPVMAIASGDLMFASGFYLAA